MKVAVYDRHWPTAGGGEMFAAGIAVALAGEHDVTLLAHEPLDLDAIGERLMLDLAGIDVQQVEADRAGAVAEATASFDLFVNASYLSRDSNRARRGVYVVHFPGFRQPLQHRVLGAAAGFVRNHDVTVSLADGFYSPEPARLHTLQWTSGEAELLVRARTAGRYPVTVLLGRYVPTQVAPVEVTAEVDDEVLGSATITAPEGGLDRRRAVPLTFEVEVPADEPVVVTLRSPVWVPATMGLGSDRRVLGVPLVGWSTGTGWRRWLADTVPLLATEQGQAFDALASYDVVLSNSQYTKGWVERLWQRESGVLYPPVTAIPRMAKSRTILGVGRFFTPGTGHNKKQLELVGAFRKLVEQEQAAGWELHLAGGVAPEHQGYFDEVQAAAGGLPVVLHPDATGEELRRLYGAASIFWHAAGLGEKAKRYPERQEHFGITTVEAMSAGAVPVVIDAGGQTEIVEEGVSGFRFASSVELVRKTQLLIDDTELIATMSEAAQLRAKAFAWDAFVANVRREMTR